jgi:hypothetical protein
MHVTCRFSRLKVDLEYQIRAGVRLVAGLNPPRTSRWAEPESPDHRDMLHLDVPIAIITAIWAMHLARRKAAETGPWVATRRLQGARSGARSAAGPIVRIVSGDTLSRRVHRILLRELVASRNQPYCFVKLTIQEVCQRGC